MKLQSWILALGLALPVYGGLNVGDAAPNLCYVDTAENSVCINQLKGAVVVLVYSAGWCPGCNEEMRELAPRVTEFKSQPVVFISLSAQGDSHGSLPDKAFLESWKKRYNIPFTVAASPGDVGQAFFDPPYYIPAIVVLDKQGKLAGKEQGMTIDNTFALIKTLL